MQGIVGQLILGQDDFGDVGHRSHPPHGAPSWKTPRASRIEPRSDTIARTRHPVAEADGLVALTAGLHGGIDGWHVLRVDPRSGLNISTGKLRRIQFVHGKETVGPGDHSGRRVPLPGTGMPDRLGIMRPTLLLPQVLLGVPQGLLSDAGCAHVKGEADAGQDGPVGVDQG